MKTIRDAVHGDIRLSADELRFVDTASFQRLRGIKQLGTSSLVYPSAVHSRFEHSLGTAWLTKRILESLDRAGTPIGREESEIAVLAALLHDVTHIPFGHTIEDERRLLPRHDRDPERLNYYLGASNLGELLDAHPLGEPVRQVLHRANEAPTIVRKLVTGTVCADLLDYLRRDAYHAGLGLSYDDRLFDYFRVVDGDLVVRLHKSGAVRQDVLSELVHLLQLRYTLTERVYYHPAKIVSGAMVSRAVELSLGAQTIGVRDLYDLRDDSLLDRMSSSADRVLGLPDLMEDILSRRLYARAYFLAGQGLGQRGLSADEQSNLARRFHQDPVHRAAAEKQLADELGIPESHVIIYCPSPAMQLKEADVPVEVGPDQVQPLSSLHHPDVDALSAKHRGLWRFYVFISRRDQSLMAHAGRSAEAMIGIPNQLQSDAGGRLSFRTK